MILNGKIVTVFGGSGFIGKYVVRELALAGYTIKVVSRNPEDAKVLRPEGFVGQIVPVKGNLRDSERLAELVEGSYAVVNLVGVLYQSGRQKFDALHAQGAERLAKAAKEMDVKKFVHISAIVDPESKSKYAKSKINGEKAVMAAFPEAYIMKPSVVFGPEDNFFNFFARLSSLVPFLPLIGGGKTKMQPVYVGDIGTAVKKVVDEEFKAGAYQLGGPEVLTFKEILQRVLEYTGRKRLLLNLPFTAARFGALFSPNFILTADQVKLLKHDNIVTSRTKTLSELEIQPTAIDSVVPKYLARFQRNVPKLLEE